MGLISAIKSVLGIGDSRDRSREGSRGTDVTVERETDATSERAVKESDADAVGDARDTDDGQGTDNTEETDEEGELTFENDPETASDADEEEADDAEAEADSADGEPVADIKGIGPAYAERLADAGVHTVSDLADADAEELGEATDIGESRLRTWIDRANAR